MNVRRVVGVVLLFISAMCCFNPCQAAEWNFPVGISYVSGMSDVVDLYEDNLEAEGYIVDTSWENPIGVSFQPYVQLENGLRIGGGVGPVAAIINSEASFFNVPINVSAGYTFLSEADMSPYVRLGLSYHLAGGEYVESVSPGIIAGVGFDFKRNSRIGFGVDLSYDSCEIEFENYRSYNYGWNTYETRKDLKPGEYNLSVFIRF
jgi:outer membrane protein W